MGSKRVSREHSDLNWVSWRWWTALLAKEFDLRSGKGKDIKVLGPGHITTLLASVYRR
jgi:hypothetical protein